MLGLISYCPHIYRGCQWDVTRGADLWPFFWYLQV